MEAFPRTIFDEVHQQFRSTFRSWLDKEVVPHHEKWEAAGITPRELWLNAGKQGFLGLNVPGAYGGGDTDDYHFAAIMAEEIGTTGVIGSAN